MALIFAVSSSSSATPLSTRPRSIRTSPTRTCARFIKSSTRTAARICAKRYLGLASLLERRVLWERKSRSMYHRPCLTSRLKRRWHARQSCGNRLIYGDTFKATLPTLYLRTDSSTGSSRHASVRRAPEPGTYPGLSFCIVEY